MAAHPPIRRALISVWDKTGLVEFARALHDEFGVEIISTGGTARALADAGVPVTRVETITGCGEMLGGRVKTLHPKIHAAILADRDNPEHLRQLAELGLEPIDLVVVNLYPFEKTVADPNCTFEQAIEMIDIGGVALLRAAAKNHRHVLAPMTERDWNAILTWMREDSLSEAGWRNVRRDYAVSAWLATSRYDAAISTWLSAASAPDPAPMLRHLHLLHWGRLRYGENPHQVGELLQCAGANAMNLTTADADLNLGVKQPFSANNYLDADAALALCADLSRAGDAVWHARWRRFSTGCSGRVEERRFSAHADQRRLQTGATGQRTTESAAGPVFVCVFIKHTNACGVGVTQAADESLESRHAARLEAYQRAYLGDPNAAMGGILAVNFPVDAEFAAWVMETYDRLGRPLREAGSANAPGGFFLEVWVAPSFSEDALAIIRGTREPTSTPPRETSAAQPHGCHDQPGGAPPGGKADLAAPPKKKWGENVRLLAVGDLSAPPDPNELVYRSIAGGMLVQSPDRLGLNEEQWKVVTQRAPTDAELADLRLAWLVCKHTKSNAITLCRGGMLIGNGAGQMSRVMSCRVATWLAHENGHLSGTGLALGDRSPTGAWDRPATALSGERLSRRHLPHIQRPEETYFVTFRVRSGELSPDERDVVLNACRYWHARKMTLHCAVVMPDHVHLLLTPLKSKSGRWVPLAELLKSIKGFSASRINKRRGGTGALWQDERFDRIVRDAADFQEKWEYIWNNPVTKGLVHSPEDYAWAWHSGRGHQDWITIAEQDQSETGPTVAEPTPVAASDAFFPFRDGVDILIDAGVTAIIQPGGSKRDAEVIAACDERGVAMIFTGTRHFRH